jgi:hypothetical protein
MDRDYDQRESLAEQQAIQERNDRVRRTVRTVRDRGVPPPPHSPSQCANCGGWHGEHTEGCSLTPITVACTGPDLVQEAMVQARLILKRSIITEWLEEVQKISSDVHERVAATNLLARIRRGG